MWVAFFGGHPVVDFNAQSTMTVISADAGESLGLPPGPGEDCGLQQGERKYRFDCVTDDLNAEEEEFNFQELFHYS